MLIKKLLKSIPLIPQIYTYFRKLEYEKKFAGDSYGSFRGVYDSFEQAIASAPSTKPVGYNNPELAAEYKQNLGYEIGASQTVRSYDYPVLFWLRKIIDESIDREISIFDFGGNVGIHFYAYQEYLSFPENLSWIVCDVPEIVKVGQELFDRQLANARDKVKDRVKNQNLSFTSDFDRASHKQVFIASGSIQYVEDLSLSLSQLSEKPEHLLINRLPLHDRDQFVTLQNGGKVFYPQHVFNRASFIDSLTKIGYTLIDVWEDRVANCIIPFHMEKSVYFYHGLYFRCFRQG